MRIDGSQVRRNTQYRARVRETVAPKFKSKGTYKMSDVKPAVTEPEDLMGDPQVQPKPAKAPKPAKPAKVKDEVVAEIIEDDEDAVTMSLVASINLAAECYGAFETLIHYMDAQLNERMLKYQALADMAKPDTQEDEG